MAPVAGQQPDRARSGHPAELSRIFWQVACHVPPLAEGASLHPGGGAEDLRHAGSEGLGAVDHAEQALLEAKAAGTRSARRAVTTVLFSVSPSQSPTGTLVPSVVITRATTRHCPAT